MSLYGFDVNGYVGDIASTSGWCDFIEWAEKVGGAIAKLAEAGMVQDDDLEALKRQASVLRPEDRDIADILKAIGIAARRADGILIVSDGAGDEVDE